jgi:hypothetical protein
LLLPKITSDFKCDLGSISPTFYAQPFRFVLF